MRTQRQHKKTEKNGNVSANISAVIDRVGLGQAELATVVGVAGQSTVSAWIVGANEPRPGVLDRLCAALSSRFGLRLSRMDFNLDPALFRSKLEETGAYQSDQRQSSEMREEPVACHDVIRKLMEWGTEEQLHHLHQEIVDAATMSPVEKVQVLALVGAELGKRRKQEGAKVLPLPSPKE